MRDKYEAVIGLEVHAQLLTESKMFCGCKNAYGAPPNSQICPVCTGQPGTLPVINQFAVELGVRAALAIKAEIHQESIFARKNYFYPDLPKGYQISQYERPFCTQGKITIGLSDGSEKEIGITRIHFEEDAGKNIHKGDHTQVDLNRAGVPLIEIVSEPDMRTAEEAGQYLRTLRTLLRYANVTDGDMEKGNFRCDANISIRPRGQKEFGTKVELKNINSFKFVEKAVDYEIDRQIRATETGEAIVQQTRGWNSAKNVSEVMREKEDAHDYRYFAEPDLPPLVLSDKWIDEIKSELPELPDQKKARFESEYGLSGYDAGVLTASRDLANYYEGVAGASKDAKTSANWVMNELLGRLNAAGKDIVETPVSAKNLADLISKVQSGAISGKIAKTVFEEMFATSKTAESIIEAQGLKQISDPSALEPVVRKVMEANPGQVAGYKAGKVKLLGFFVGQVMKETKGQANPGLVNDIVKKLLDS
ncbi:MAG: Asp-tRNA(Asn)/Glu-tRNA(Gln) amidotransferase subunit GatB [Bdellovibrionaceae bacterium]|nr:Asp-tRNA(Asn)/Glu-tRNA(Gln) amidotransferase subunit GatB [Pseudobdellovibrionaceae bacterium]